MFIYQRIPPERRFGTKPPSKLVVFGASSGGDVCCVAWVFDSAAWAFWRYVCDTKFCCVKWYLLVVRNEKTIGKFWFKGIEWEFTGIYHLVS